MGELRFSPDGIGVVGVGLDQKSLYYNTVGNAAEWMLHEQRSAIKWRNFCAIRLMDANLAN